MGAIQELDNLQAEYTAHQDDWKLERLEIALNERNIDLSAMREMQPIGENSLLYLGYAGFYNASPSGYAKGEVPGPIAHRLIESFDPGSVFPLYVLNIRATDATIYLGHVEGHENDVDIYKEVEKVLIAQFMPPLNKRRTPPAEMEITNAGDWPT